MTPAERFTKNLLQKFGILIRKYTPGSSEELRRIKLLKHLNIDVVFDIGANRGQYAQGLIDAGYGNKIISFEPLSDAHAKLSAASSGNDNWNAAPRCAVGSQRGETEINISENSVSSTLLNMLDTHVEGAPESRIVSKEKVEVIPLDDMSPEYTSPESRIFLKIDVEGFESEVLAGAQKTLERTSGLEMEISLVPLYTGQKFLLPEVLEYMRARNFLLVSINPGFTDFTTGQVLQCNGIFMKQ